MPASRAFTKSTWQFLSKGKTLSQLQNNIQNAAVLPLLCLSKASYSNMNQAAIDAIFVTFQHQHLVVRSSYSREDSADSSMAGMFESVVNISHSEQLKHAIEQVFNSYPQHHSADEEVLIQPMAQDIKHCGVIFSIEQSSSAPYIIISDDVSGKTDTVTSGAKGEIDTYYIKRGHPPTQALPKRLVPLVEELIAGFQSHALDIEYAIDHDDNIWLFQVRPLLTTKTRSTLTSSTQQIVGVINNDKALQNIHQKLNTAMQTHPFLFGHSTVFGVMPDWNPAEIIGLYPKPLALSLYKSLITDSTWAYQRHNYGYRNLRSFPLMVDFMGIPYIDVRVSFNSFLPKDISPKLGHKLVNYYIEQLKQNPKSHDSVEFDIVLSCYTLSINKKLSELQEHGFSPAECKELAFYLRNLTNIIIDPRTGLWIQDLHRIEKLKQRHALTQSGFEDPVSRIYWLLEDCKRYGTLPFAGLARAAFIAIQLIQSLLEQGILTDAQYHAFLSSLNTVSSKMQLDLSRLSKSQFLAEYGHLRPGTYDVLSARYDQAPDQYFDWHAATQDQSNDAMSIDNTEVISPQTYANIDAILNEHGINHSADSLLHFIKSAIEGREYAKFIFTRNLSDAMEEFVKLGESYGFTRENMAFANINIINQLMTGSDDPQALIKQSIDEGLTRFNDAQTIKLPTLIFDPNDAYEFKVAESQPSFVTLSKVTAPVTQCNKDAALCDKIVCITSADPGYDWIFSHNIKGFITAYGGCNSHMAIRAAELNIPAVIGAGEQNFARWSQAQLLTLDCQSNTVTILK